LKKILVIRFSSIGDIVLTTPVIRVLKKQLHCELHVLTKEQYSTIFLENPYVDQIHAFKGNIKEVLQQLKLEHFDFVVDLQKNYRSIKLHRKLKVPSASFPKINKQKWLLVNFKIDKLPDLHIVDRYFEAVTELNIKNDMLGLDYFIPAGDEVRLNEIYPELQNGYIGFVIGGRHNTKILPVEKVVSIIEPLHLPVLLLGGPEDKERGSEIAQKVKSNKVINTCGQFILNQSASLVKQAKLIITNDTGLMHIAAAFKKPVISIWGNTIPKFGMYPYLPGNKNLSFLAEVEGLQCRPCSKLGFSKCPKKHFRCMLDQDEKVIVEKARELTLDLRPKTRDSRNESQEPRH